MPLSAVCGRRCYLLMMSGAPFAKALPFAGAPDFGRSRLRGRFSLRRVPAPGGVLGRRIDKMNLSCRFTQ